MEFRIDTSSRAPIHQQLREQFRQAVARGTLLPGDHLPSVRELSRTLVVNPNTIAKVYTELEREGLLNIRPGLGVYVAELKTELTKKVRKQRLIELLDQFLTEAVHLGFSADEVISLAQERSGEFAWQSN